MTQEQLAEALGITPRYVQELEGKNCPSVGLDKLEILAKKLKAKPKEFLEE